MQREQLAEIAAFVAVAQERSFTRAAAKLGITQSSLSHTIRRLEAKLGVRLLARTTAPPEAIILGKLGPVFANLLLKLALIAAAVFSYRMPLPLTAALAPIGLLGLALLGTAVGLLIAPLNLLYRDISWVFGTVTTIWFFFSPVYFSPPATGTVGVIMNLNPVTPLLADTRSLLLTGTAITPIRSILIIGGACLLLMASWFCIRIVLWVAMEQVNE